MTLNMDTNVAQLWMSKYQIPNLIDTGAIVSVMSESLRESSRKAGFPYTSKQLLGRCRDFSPVGICTARIHVQGGYTVVASFCCCH